MLLLLLSRHPELSLKEYPLEMLNFDPTHPLLHQEQEDHISSSTPLFFACEPVVVQLHPAAQICSDVIGQLHHCYRHYRSWNSVTNSACEKRAVR